MERCGGLVLSPIEEGANLVDRRVAAVTFDPNLLRIRVVFSRLQGRFPRLVSIFLIVFESRVTLLAPTVLLCPIGVVGGIAGNFLHGTRRTTTVQDRGLKHESLQATQRTGITGVRRLS
jgi:hypothetical protein